MSDGEPNHIIVHAEPATFRVSPLGFFMHARDFLTAAELLVKESTRVSQVARFLYCRAIEGALKAYLLARGNSVDQVRQFRHDLTRLLTESYARGIDAVIDLSESDKKALLEVNADYVEHRLGYFDLVTTMGLRPEADASALASVAQKLVTGVERGCYEAGHGDWKPFE